MRFPGRHVCHVNNGIYCIEYFCGLAMHRGNMRPLLVAGKRYQFIVLFFNIFGSWERLDPWNFLRPRNFEGNKLLQKSWMKNRIQYILDGQKTISHTLAYGKSGRKWTKVCTSGAGSSRPRPRLRDTSFAKHMVVRHNSHMKHIYVQKLINITIRIHTDVQTIFPAKGG